PTALRNTTWWRGPWPMPSGSASPTSVSSATSNMWSSADRYSACAAAILLVAAFLCACADHRPDTTQQQSLADALGLRLSDNERRALTARAEAGDLDAMHKLAEDALPFADDKYGGRSEEHTSELQSR